MTNKKNGAILIISGPSGCGKSTLLKEIYKNVDDYYFSISTTTREKRIGEQHGKDYWFVSTQQFEQDIKNNHFLEWAMVHGHYYGTSLRPILQALDESKLVIFDIDVQGHRIVKERLESLVTSVFIATPSLKELEERLYKRETDKQEVIKKRLTNAKKEITSFEEYDYLIVNDNLENAARELLSIANATRVKSSLFQKEDFLNEWLHS